MARKFNLPIIPIQNTRLNNGDIELSFHKPIFHNNENINDKKRMEQIHKIIETWIMSSLHGTGKVIPFRRASNIYRPFLMTEKRSIKRYAEKHQVSWIEDPSNSSTHYMRNYVRKHIVPHALKVNPGLRKVLRKKMLELYVK